MCGDLFIAEADDDERRRCMWRPDQLSKQHGAVGIGPMKVVDAENERLPICQAAQQLAQRHEGALPQFDRIHELQLDAFRRLDGIRVQHHRKQLQQRRDVDRYQRFGLCPGMPLKNWLRLSITPSNPL